MIETTIAIVLALVLWNLRKAFYSQSDVFKESIDLSVKDREADLQEDYKELNDKVVKIKQANGGKWFSLSDIESQMSSDTAN